MEKNSWTISLLRMLCSKQGRLLSYGEKMAWFNCANNELNVDVLDSDVCDGTDVDTAEALENSFFLIGSYFRTRSDNVWERK